MEIKNLFETLIPYKDGQNSSKVTPKRGRTGDFGMFLSNIKDVVSSDAKTDKNPETDDLDEGDDKAHDHRESMVLGNFYLLTLPHNMNPENSDEQPGPMVIESNGISDPEPTHMGEAMIEDGNIELMDLQEYDRIGHGSQDSETIPSADTLLTLEASTSNMGPISFDETIFREFGGSPRVEMKYVPKIDGSHNVEVDNVELKAGDISETFMLRGKMDGVEIDLGKDTDHIKEDASVEAEALQKIDTEFYIDGAENGILKENLGGDTSTEPETAFYEGKGFIGTHWEIAVDKGKDFISGYGSQLSNDDEEYKAMDKDIQIDEEKTIRNNGDSSMAMAHTIIGEDYLDFTQFINKEKASNAMKTIEKISDKMVTVLNSNETQLEVQLYPESLGRIILEVSLKEGNLIGKITANTEETKDILQSRIGDLKASLGERGLNFASLDVNVDERSGPKNFYPERYRGSKINKTGARPQPDDMKSIHDNRHDGIAGRALTSRIDFLA